MHARCTRIGIERKICSMCRGFCTLVPFIFTAVADILQWIMANKGVCPVFHYLDDFVTLGPSQSDQCQCNLLTLVYTCKQVGAPLEEEKCEGPAPILTFADMELDPKRIEIWLPLDKLELLCKLLAEWESRKAGKKRELLSLS